MNEHPHFPELVWYRDFPWELGYSNLFGNGYVQLTDNYKKSPKGTFLDQRRMLGLLKTGEAKVLPRRQPGKAIIDTLTYQEWRGSQGNGESSQEVQNPVPQAAPRGRFGAALHQAEQPQTPYYEGGDDNRVYFKAGTSGFWDIGSPDRVDDFGPESKEFFRHLAVR